MLEVEMRSVFWAGDSKDKLSEFPDEVQTISDTYWKVYRQVELQTKLNAWVARRVCMRL